MNPSGHLRWFQSSRDFLVFLTTLSLGQARELFLEGVNLEESGKLYEAIRYYKRAVSLVPNIEQETFVYTRKNKRQVGGGGSCEIKFAMMQL